MRWIPFIFCSVVAAFQSRAQVNDSIELHSVIISAEKPSGVPGLKSVKIDSAILGIRATESLGTVLQRQSSITIKTYGPSGIQTPTFRGMSSSHTKLYVNGLDISPGSLGQNDLSIFPTFLFDNIALKYGNSAFTEGVGAIGGGIMLNSSSYPISEGFSAKVGVFGGSFNQIGGQVQLGYRKGKWTSISRVISQKAENNFEFRNIAQPEELISYQKHAEKSVTGFSQHLGYQLNSKNKFHAMVLGSYSNRNLPAYMTDTRPSKQSQADDITLFQLGWKNLRENTSSEFIAGYTYSDQIYTDSNSAIYSTTQNSRWQLRENYVWNFNSKWALNSTTTMDYYQANNPNYFGNQSLFQLASLLGVSGHIAQRWEMGMFIQPVVNQENFEWLPMMSLAFLPGKSRNAIISMNLAQNVHFPTLNDLYWVPGGNLALQPEKSSTIELNTHFTGVLKSKWNWMFDMSGFAGKVDNWILWKPSDLGYFEAQNVKTVDNHGVEGQWKLSRKYQKWNWVFSGSYQFVRAINKDVDDVTYGKQLIYTPTHSANWLLGIERGALQLFVNYDFVGKRHITSDNTTYLPAYDLVNLTLNYHWKLSKDHVLDIQLDANNIFQKEYMSVAWQAMPKANYLIRVNYAFR